MTLQQWLRKNKIHLIIFAVLVAYLLSASQLYATFFLKNGKPIAGPADLPAEKGEVLLTIDDLQERSYDGQDIYVLSGWVFDPKIAESGSFKKKLVLHSTSENRIFSAETVTRKELKNMFAQYDMKLDDAGFRVFISKDVLKIDNYRIGILLEDEQGNLQVFRMVDQYIEREPNGLRYISGR